MAKIMNKESHSRKREEQSWKRTRRIARRIVVAFPTKAFEEDNSLVQAATIQPLCSLITA
jgi:hypothetical protein